jgi:hypothetical protein
METVKTWLRWLSWVALGGIAVWVAWLAATGFFDPYLDWNYWQTGKDGKVQSSRSEVVRNLGLLLLGLIGLCFGVYRSWLAYKQQRTAEQGHITERFTQAVEQLGSDNAAVRQGAIHALWRIAEDSPKRD